MTHGPGQRVGPATLVLAILCFAVTQPGCRTAGATREVRQGEPGTATPSAEMLGTETGTTATGTHATRSREDGASSTDGYIANQAEGMAAEDQRRAADALRKENPAVPPTPREKPVRPQRRSNLPGARP